MSSVLLYIESFNVDGGIQRYASAGITLVFVGRNGMASATTRAAIEGRAHRGGTVASSYAGGEAICKRR